MNNRLINTKVAGGGGGCTDIVDNYDPFGDSSGLALYQLNGNANDVSGSNNGFSVTSITWGSPGVFDTAASYPGGTSAKIGVPDIINSHSTTISAWVKGSGYWFTPQKEIYAPLGTSSLYWGASGTSTTLTGVEDGNWHHIAVCATSARTVDYYVDGIQVAHNVSATDFPQDYNYSDNWIGHFYHPSTPQSFNGLIDQFRIFNRGLTSLEVEALYTEELCICDGTVDTLQVLGDTSCIATYQLDGNANDLSGNYSGTPTNISYGVGEFDLAGVFNGSSSSIELPIVGASTGVVTYSLWTKLTVTQTFNTIISVGTVSTQLRQILFYQPTNLIQVQVRDGSDSSIILSFDATSLLSQYVHIAFTQNGANIALYVNGVLRDSTTMTGFRNSYAGSHFIGKRASNNDQYINASIDQVRIFNKALSAGEVTTLYNETACTKAACTGTTNTLDILGDSSCIAAYPLDGSPADLSGNYNGVQTDVTYPQGYFDLAGSFNGSSSVVALPSALSDGVTTNATCISFWFNVGSEITSATPNNEIMNFAQSSSNFGKIAIGSTTGNFAGETFSVSSDVTSQYTYITENIPAGWNHAVVQWNSSTAKWDIYINSVAKSTNTFGINEQGKFALKFGNRSSFYFNGQLDQVRVFNKALSAGEVTTLYNETPCN